MASAKTIKCIINVSSGQTESSKKRNGADRTSKTAALTLHPLGHPPKDAERRAVHPHVLQSPVSQVAPLLGQSAVGHVLDYGHLS
ncbi:rCG33036 [Rattus norvegicus]|uniref:RCG33036 n=1 Tax=Rattus norvegicus TaxID=10116 RepID=A6HFE0_RAT|nr:rCG33036 [Rattus norvegicus]